MRFKDLKLSTKLTATYITVGLLPIIILAGFTIYLSSKTISHDAYEKLGSIQNLKKTAIETYFNDMALKMGIFAKSKDVKLLYDELVVYHNDMNTSATGNYDVLTERYEEIWQTLGGNILEFYKESGVYDVFLICAKHGHVMFTAAKESDLGENIGHGQYKDSGLAKLREKIIATKKMSIVDMAPYAPSDNKPAMFAGYPIKNDSGSVIGIVAFQLPLSQINQVMNTRYGLGKSGESYLVGSDKLMRSDSLLYPDVHSVAASFANPDKGMVDTEASRNALAGKKGQKITKNYKETPVLSCYDHFDLMGLTWAIITEIDEKEAFASIQIMKIYIGIIVVISTIVIFFIGLFMSRMISKPVIQGVNLARSIAQGDLTQTLDIRQKDEIGILAEALSSMSVNLRKMFGDIASGVETLSSSSTELSAISDQMTASSDQTSEKTNSVAAASEEMTSNMNSVAAASEETTTNIQMIVAASEEMSVTINEISVNTSKGTEITAQAVQYATDVSAKVEELGIATKEISQITETITDISEQTNLLALNATIEAARAGEAGKGFAVVASEIKELSKQTAEATFEIKSQIGGVQTITADSVKAIESIVTVINEINDIVTTVATAISEQSATTQEISNNVSQAAAGVQEMNHNVNETSRVSEEVTKDITNVSIATGEISTGSQQVNISAGELSQLAEKINGLVSKFTI